MNQNKFTTNNNPTLVAVSDADGETPVYLYADPITHALVTSTGGGGGGSDVQYADGATLPTNPIGNALIWSNAGTAVAVSAANPLPVSATISTAGLATSVKQDTGNASLSSIDGKITAVNTGAVVVLSSALPSGASTSALQTTGNTSLSSIDTKTPALGQALAAASVPVVLTTAQLTTLTPLSSVSVSNFPTTQPVSGSVSVSNFPASQVVTLSSTTITGSVAVTGTFFQATQPVSATSLPLPTGAATAAKQPALGTAGTASTDVITIQGKTGMTAVIVDGSAIVQPISATALPLPTGAATSAKQLPDNHNVVVTSAPSTPVTGTFFQSTQPVSAASLPLPTGAATSSLQTTGNTSLSSIDGKLSGTLSVSGSTVGSSSGAVNVGQKTVNTTAVQISSSSTVPTNGILVGALSTNTASIFIGGSGVTTSTGAELLPGASLPFTANLNTLYIISVASTTDKIWWNVA